MYSKRLEGIAQSLLARARVDAPVDAFELAAGLGLEIVAADVKDALLYDRTIYLSRRVRVSLVHPMIAHEIGHWAQREDGADDTEEGADYLAAALLVPRASLLPVLRSGWDLEDVRRRHPHAPVAMVASRIAIVREGTAALYDGNQLLARIGPEHAAELALRDEALCTGQPVRMDDCTGAWPLSGRRVIVLAAAA